MTTKARNNTSGQEAARVRALEAELQALKDKMSVNDVPEEVYTAEDNKIQQDDYIPVMNLLPYTLNLSTQENGQGTNKKFTKFGEIKKILYKDLVDILEVHFGFVEAGYFYILDQRVIRQHGLDEIYSKILTKEKIEEILATSSEESVKLYASANEKQQEVIVQLLVEKIKANPESVNLNIIDKLSRLSKIDIQKRAEDAKELETRPETSE